MHECGHVECNPNVGLVLLPQKHFTATLMKDFKKWGTLSGAMAGMESNLVDTRRVHHDADMGAYTTMVLEAK